MLNSFANVPPGTHTLPPLPYPYNALEPVIDAKTMEIHHNVLHKGIVDNLNKTELALVEVRKQGNYDFIKFPSLLLFFGVCI
jgi:Fe-Mn family superoxide dismutase